MSTLIASLDTFRAHLARHPELPELVSVQLQDSYFGDHVRGQLNGANLARIATKLLAWADTLHEYTAHAWRVPDGESVHVDVIGNLNGACVLRVFAGVSYDPDVFPDLEPDGRQSVGVSTLRGWVADGAGVAA